jgi:hypothetical protein
MSMCPAGMSLRRVHMVRFPRFSSQATLAVVLLAMAGCVHPNPGSDSHVPVVATTSGDIEESGPPPPGSYSVRRPRHIEAGEAYDVRILTTIDITTTMGDIDPSVPPKVDHKASEGEVSGRVDVSAVDRPNRKLDLVFTVAKFISPKGETILQPGSVVDIHGDAGKVSSTLRGGKLPGDAVNSLAHLGYSLDGEFDDALQSTKYRKPGESWQIGEPTKDLKMAAGGFSVDIESESGEAMLKSVETIDGVSAMRVEAAMVIRLKPQDVPFGLHLDFSQTTLSVKALLPVEASAQALEVENEMDMEVNMHGNILFRSVKTAVVTRQRMDRKRIAK